MKKSLILALALSLGFGFSPKVQASTDLTTVNTEDLQEFAEMHTSLYTDIDAGELEQIANEVDNELDFDVNYATDFAPQTSVDAYGKRGAPLWVCRMGFKGYAKGFKVIIGKYKFHGAGTLKCISANGKKVRYPVYLSMNALPISPGIALGKYTVYGQSGKISLFHTNPDKILGNYLVAQAHATIVGGVGFISAVKVGLPQLTLGLSLNVQKGFGFDASVNKLRITPRGKARYY